MTYTFNTFLDASAIISWLLHPDVKQPGGEALAGQLDRPGCSPYTNELCIAEALSRFKWMRKYKEISDEEYSMRVYYLGFRLDQKSLTVSPFNHRDKTNLDRAIQLVEKYKFKIDVIDALQIIDVVDGPYNFFAGPSQTVLATCDKALCDAAREQGVRVWYPVEEPEPKFEMSTANNRIVASAGAATS